ERSREPTSTPVLGRPPLEVVDFAAGVPLEEDEEPVEDDAPLLDPAAAATTTVPCMNGWIVHTYENVPACVKACDPLWPFLSVPVSKPLPVAVWADGPAFVQVTVSPTCTVTELGPNLKSLMVTPGSPAALTLKTFLAWCFFPWCFGSCV